VVQLTGVQQVEAEFPIRLMLPSELVREIQSARSVLTVIGGSL